jgi:predicted AlkP superfamily phosphohydrolase/phosphomutase
MDGALAKLLEKVDAQTTLIVLSDHGFAPFYRAFHLNSWLRSQGYVSLLDFSQGEMLQNVDWKNTRAYATGFNLLYLKLRLHKRALLRQVKSSSDCRRTNAVCWLYPRRRVSRL